jgi:hypothetical protein
MFIRFSLHLTSTLSRLLTVSLRLNGSSLKIIDDFVFLLPIINISLMKTVDVSSDVANEQNGLSRKTENSSLKRIGDKFDLKSEN